MKKQTWKIFAALALLTALAPAAAPAHDMWLTLDQPQAGRPLHILAGYGHAFPDNEGTEPEKLIPAYILGPKGRIETKAGEKLDFTSATALAEGSYIVVSGRKAQFYTKTPEGSQDLPRNKVSEAVSCLRSAKYAKAVVNLGGGAGDLSMPVGQTLEIVPLVNPATLKGGAELPVLVRFEGSPLGGAQLFATYAGFSTHANTFAFAARTDKEGKAHIKVWQPGTWLVIVKHEVPFTDPAECDKFAHTAALTFEIR